MNIETLFALLLLIAPLLWILNNIRMNIRKKKLRKKLIGKQVLIRAGEGVGKKGVIEYVSNIGNWEYCDIKYPDKSCRGGYGYDSLFPMQYLEILDAKPKGGETGRKNTYKMPKIIRIALYSALVVLVWRIVLNIDAIALFFATKYL